MSRRMNGLYSFGTFYQIFGLMKVGCVGQPPKDERTENGKESINGCSRDGNSATALD